MTDFESTMLIKRLKDWFDQRKEQLEKISNHEGRVKFEGDDGGVAELSGKESKAFTLGVSTALEVLGDFPISFESDEEE